MAIRISPGLGKILRGSGELLALGFKRKANQDLVRRIADQGSEALEDGLSIDLEGSDEKIGVSVRRHRRKGGR